MILFFSAFLLGLSGSFHCAGMCGPIALLLSTKGTSVFLKISNILLYNAGRIVTYSILGLIFGIAGKGFHLAGMQQFLSVATGTIMIFSVVGPLIFQKNRKPAFIKFSLFQNIKIRFSGLLHENSLSSVFMVGLLNGLLPCGLVYLAIALAITAPDSFSGMLTMASFGMATAIMLVFISIIGSTFGKYVRIRILKLIPYIIVLMGLLFVARGLNLGIRYISPKEAALTPAIASDTCKEHHCCH